MAEDNKEKERNANQLLLEATENQISGKMEDLKNLLKSRRELFSQRVLDQSLLSCCRQNGLFLLPEIISAGANLEFIDENGNTPLLVCALHNNESCARCLLGAGANVNAVNFDGNTSLIVSVLNNDFIAMTNLLVGSHDIKIDHANNKGYTALLYALETANLNAIKLLIDADDRGADPNVKVGEEFYTYPIHTLLSKEFEYMLLEKRRNSANHVMSNSSLISEIKDLIECFLRHGAQVDVKDFQCQTALHIATRESHDIHIVKLLIEYGADVNQTNNDGDNPLRKAVENEDVEMVECLINSGADINFVYESTGKPVIFEVMDESILKILLDNGADVKNIDGDSLLNSLLAECCIGTENVKRLIGAGCDVNHVNNNGYTALILAADYADIELLKLIVQEGADVNASAKKFPYRTAITATFIKLWNDPEEATSCINYLLDHDANIDKVHPGVIHVLMTSGCLSLMPRFISCGLPPTSISINDSRDPLFTFNTCFSPLLMALVLKQSDLVKYFININYFMKSDIDVLYGKWDLPIDKATVAKGLKLLKKVVQGPLSLETVCLIVISETLGHIQDRRSKVEKLEIAQTLKNALLWKNYKRRDIKDVYKRNLYYYKHSLQLLNLHQIDPEFDDASEYFDSGEEL